MQNQTTLSRVFQTLYWLIKVTWKVANSKADKQVAPNQGALSYRLTAGMKDLNKVLEGPTYISLPREDEINSAL